jgi:hypothetical protein
MSDEYFILDGTLIEASATQRTQGEAARIGERRLAVRVRERRVQPDSIVDTAAATPHNQLNLCPANTSSRAWTPERTLK